MNRTISKIEIVQKKKSSTVWSQSQHYAGLAFDVGQNLTAAQRNAKRNLAISSGIWNYVEPATQIFKKII